MKMQLGGGDKILTLDLKHRESLYKAYMPFVKGGGLFVNTAREYKIGEDVFVLLNLPEQTEPVPFSGKIVWISPPGSNTHLPGIGIQLGEDNRELMNLIETQLAGQLNSEKTTDTL